MEKIAYMDESGIDTYNCLEHFVSAGDGSMLPLMIAAMEDENDREFMEWLYLQYPRLIYSEVRKLV